MGHFEGLLKMDGEPDSGIGVEIDLENERLLIRTKDTVLGEWAMSDIGVRSADDGFHLRIEGEQVILRTSDDAGFAIEIGLQSASPRLRRMIGARRRA